ncbi:MAG: DNA polymerase Y family protein [Nannocystaceae bacterium]
MIDPAIPRLTCVRVPELGLQRIERDLSLGTETPIAAVDRPGSAGRLCAVNPAAHRAGARVGARASAALGLCPALRMVVLDEAALTGDVEAIADLLERFSPRVEASADTPGLFWIDPAGMTRLFGDLERWSAAIERALVDAGWRSVIVVGFGRFLGAAIALCSRGVRILPAPADERAAAAEVPLVRLGLPHRRADALAAIDVHTLGDLLRLPAAELRGRFGREVAELHARASGCCDPPLRPRPPREVIEATIVIDPPDDQSERLLFAIKAALPALLARLQRSGERARALTLTLELEHEAPLALRIEPAEPCEDARLLLDLIRHRLAGLGHQLAAPVAEITILAEGTRPPTPQLELEAEAPRRDPRAAARALAQIRAAFGDASVTRARLKPAHLPEAGFTWEPAQELRPPRLRPPAANLSEGTSMLLRRLLPRPLPMGAKAGGGPDAPPRPTIAGVEAYARGAIDRLHGPYRVSGGWWNRLIERDYYYAETSAGDLLWLFYDRPRQRWFLHGVVD